MVLYTGPEGTFLSERTIGGRTGKVLKLASNGKLGKRPYYKEKYGEVVLSTKEGSHIRDLDLDVYISG